ncbi:thiol reductant ABC exporter subunit CydD [Tropicimonas aquimaris]|uniref:Thiol reductant ABC exporter subunit CydD n=1 Tax=Tropicimonas aquimaris TaxID=914152 RepID=A0ABW3ILY0_9RHOB
MSGKDASPAGLRLLDAVTPVKARLDRAGWVSVVAALLWLPQASAVAWLLSELVHGRATISASLTGAVGFAALGTLRAWLQALSDRLSVEAADEVLAVERSALVRREGRRSPMAGGPGSAAVAALASEKLAALSPYLTRYRPAWLRAAVVPLVILAVSAWYSWAVALVLLVAGPLIPVFMALVGMAARDASARQMEEIGSLNTLLLERLQALVDIRLLDGRTQVLEGFAERAEALRARTMEVLRIAFLSLAVLELFSALGVAMVAVYVGFSLLGTISFGAWTGPLTLGQGIFLLLLAPEFFQPLRDVAAAWHDKAAATAVAAELVEVEAEISVALVGAGVTAVSLPGAPSLQTVGVEVLAAPGRRLTFPDFTVPAGGTCALVGASGRGKSTLLAALAGLVPVAGGEIRVAGHVLGDQTADAWRMRIGWVPQAPHFFTASLGANLRLGAPGASAEEVLEALAVARAEDILQRMPRGLLTRLGETGAGVSGGEARRLMLARAALGAADVILADEPTSNLDAETAEAVTDSLLALAGGGATLVVATHDPALAARMDQQIRLEATA